MKKIYALVFFAFTTLNVMAQFDVTINVTDVSTSQDIQSADVTFNSVTQQTDVNGNTVFTNIANGTYNYSISSDCYESINGSIVVNNADFNNSYSLNPLTTANVFFEVNQDNIPISNPVALAEITLSDGVNAPIVLTYEPAAFNDTMFNVPFGTYNYTIEVDCREDATGSLTVDCTTIDPNNPTPTVALFTTQGNEITTANVFFEVNQDNIPISNPVTLAEITLSDGVNAPIVLTYEPAAFNDTMFNVPFGTYNYTIEVDCREDATGSLTVDCTTIDPNNPTPTVALFTTQGNEITTANVFFEVNQDNIPISNPVALAEITLSDGVNAPIVLTYEPAAFNDTMFNVPFGTYNYTIEVDCREDATGSITIDCTTIDPNNPTPTVALFTTQGNEITTANVFFEVNQDNIPISNPVALAEITLSDGVNAPIVLTYEPAAFNDTMFNVPFGTYNYTIEVDCREDATGSITVDCTTIDPNNPTPTVALFTTQGNEITTANVFFEVNQDNIPISNPVALAEITLSDGVNAPIVLTYEPAAFNDTMFNVPFGTYNYTIEVDCREDATGSITVDCTTIDPNNPTPTVALFTTQGNEITTANVFFEVNQDNIPISNPVALAEITLSDGVNAPIVLTYEPAAFNDTMFNVPFGTYNYTIEVDCREDATGSITVDCTTIDPNNPTPTVALFTTQGNEITTANVFFEVNQDNIPISNPVALAEITLNDGVNAPIVLTYEPAAFNDTMFNVPFGTYNYTIEVDCREDATGSLTVDCTTIDPNNPTPTVALFTTQGNEITTANVFFEVNQDNIPISNPVALAEITLNDGVNAPIVLTYEPAAFNDTMFNVPFGTYNYMIEVDCREDATGSLTVDCTTIDPNNPTPTVALFTTQGNEITTANVFFEVNQDNIPISNPVALAEITLSDGVNAPIVLTYEPAAFNDTMFNVPFGTYNYTIEVDCREDATGSLTVDCTTIDPNNPTPTVAVFTTQGNELTIDVSVVQNSEVLTANESGTDITYQWVDCDNGNAPIAGEVNQTFTATQNGNYAVIISNSNCNITGTSACFEVNTLSTQTPDSPIELSLYPNPIQDYLNLKIENNFNKTNADIYTIQGRLVKSVNLGNSVNSRVNLSELQSGTYILRVQSGDKVITQKIIKK